MGPTSTGISLQFQLLSDGYTATNAAKPRPDRYMSISYRNMLTG